MGNWINTILRPLRESRSNFDSQIRFYNFWDYPSIKSLWFYRFIVHRGIKEKINQRQIDFYSVFGQRKLASLFRSGNNKNIFFTGENLENYPAYRDHLLGEIDLSIGFEYIDHPKYFRFPLWLLYIIQPEWGRDEIKAHIDKTFNQTPFSERPGYCCLVASHDRNGIRRRIMDEVSRHGPVNSGGKIYHNSNSLKDDFGNVKSDFLKQYKLNICPENSNTPGYVTEKLFQSLESGCIPLYWGSDNRAEPQILNQEAIWYFQKDPQNQSDLKVRLEQVRQDQSVYKQWCRLPKFLPSADEKIADFLDQLEARIIQA